MLLIQLLLFPFCATAQFEIDSTTSSLAGIAVERTLPQVTIGMHMPDDINAKILFADRTNINLSGYMGKLLILDFWHQWCGSCLKLMPKIERLQKEYLGKLVILPVTFQSVSSVKSFQDRLKQRGAPLLLPTIVEDTLLRKMFPHHGDPYEVWIDENGVVLALTKDTEISERNINAVLAGQSSNLVNTSWQWNFDQRKAFLINKNGAADSFYQYRSIITKRIDSIPDILYYTNRDSNRMRVFISNASIKWLYKVAYSHLDSTEFMDSKSRLPFSSIEKRIVEETSSGEKINTEINSPSYCYELTLPAEFSTRSTFNFMVQDLDRFFSIHSEMKKMKVKCYSLIRTSKNSNYVHQKYKYKAKNETKVQVFNFGIDDNVGTFIEQLNRQYPNLPLIVDETNLPRGTNINFEINTDNRTIIDLQKQLKRHGFALARRELSKKVIILKCNGGA